MDLGDGVCGEGKAERREDVNAVKCSEHEDHPFFLNQ